MESAPKVVLYPGSFDCLTNGHLDLIERGRRLFDKLIVAVAVNSKKTPLFSLDERVEALREVCARMPNVECTRLEGLTVDYASRVGAQFILRGLRAVSDFEYELSLAITNQQLRGEIETIFLAPAPRYIFLSSSMVLEVWRHGGDISGFVPPQVLRRLDAKRAAPPA